MVKRCSACHPQHPAASTTFWFWSDRRASMMRPSSIRPGLQVSRLGFGGAPIGNLYEKVPEEEAQAALAAALDQGGIRYFDTAPLYGHGLSEERMGRAFSGRPRDSYVGST